MEIVKMRLLERSNKKRSNCLKNNDKNQFVAAVATKTGKAKSETAEMVDAIFDTITQTMIKGTMQTFLVLEF